MNCRHCHQPLEHLFVDLGSAPPSNAYLRPDQLTQEEDRFPLKVYVCDRCWLVQIDEYQHHSKIFDEQYAYFSSYSSSWLAHARRYTEMIRNKLALGSESRVIEIASNDGYLLQYFQEQQIPCLGIEPTASTARAARDKGIEVVEDFFGLELAQRLTNDGHQADLVVGNNVIAHVPDINDFVQGLQQVLKPEGVITLEFPHLLQLVQQHQFDTIYHEHFSYLSLATLEQILTTNGLAVFDVEELSTHGGSLRVYAQHQHGARTRSARVAALLDRERAAGLCGLEFYQGFQAVVEGVREDLCRFLRQAKAENKRVCAYGAAAKGNTLLNFCGIGTDLIEYVVDRSPHKQGKLLPGSHLPILAPEELRVSRPDYVLLLPWNLTDEITRQHRYVSEWGGRFVTAIPRLQVHE